MRWEDLIIAPDRTHHLHQNLPAYQNRFDEVQKFHFPGLAPVRDASGAYHIDVMGQAAYAERYRHTWGFYEERAAVQTDEGWLHIRVCGSPLSTERYTWCGNFQQGRCPVRSFDQRYFHLRLDGEPAYTERYWYAGDYRDGWTVIQREDGHHSHIDLQGSLLHGKWFLDLDVFHKGYARACDAQGWHHINVKGLPIYSQRFAAVEPFYNGQARVRDLDGSLLVIDEYGEVVVTLWDALRLRNLDFHLLG